jgi:hypothetical protein
MNRANMNERHDFPLHGKRNAGTILVTVIIFAAIAITMTIGLVNWGTALLQSTRIVAQREQALQIAEAGIDYYRWHLAHAPTDYYDGMGSTSTPPYIHQFYDKDGNLLGSYALTITPPAVGSTLVTIVSQGNIASTTISRTIKVTMAIPSFAQYAVIANDNMNFGSGTVTYGPIQSNLGIHFDGIAHGPVSSALTTYTDPDSSSCTTNNSWAVHTCVAGTGYPNGDPTSPTALPTRSDIFTVGRSLGVPAVDFSSLTANLATLQTEAQSAGVLLTQSQYHGSNADGYHIVLNTNNTFSLYVVTALQALPSGNDGTACSKGGSGVSQWGLWTIGTQQFVQTYAIPSNGIVFVEDNAWVDGQINGSHITIVAAKLPDPGAGYEPNITINSNLLYTNTNGSDTIGLIAQGNVNVGYGSSNTLTIDGALVAQNGRVGRYYYVSNCGSSYLLSTLNLFGMIATNQRYGFAWSSGSTVVSGYQNRNLTYDANLLYGPPPSFPLTSSFYTTLSWQEIP